MNWAEIRQSAGIAVHRSFAVPAQHYVSADGSGIGSVVGEGVRLISSEGWTGDLDREGYARVLDDTERLVFWVTDAQALQIKTRQTVRLSSGELFYLEAKLPPREPNTVSFEVERL